MTNTQTCIFTKSLWSNIRNVLKYSLWSQLSKTYMCKQRLEGKRLLLHVGNIGTWFWSFKSLIMFVSGEKYNYCNILRWYLEHFHFHSKKQCSSTKAHHLNQKGELNSDSKIQKYLYCLGWNSHTTFSENQK